MAREDLQRAWVWQRRMPPCALRRYTPLARPYLTMSLNAPAMSGYSNTKPVSCALSGSTFWPSSTTTAPSPSTALSAGSGAGSHDGRPIAAPSAEQNSDMRTGCGAVALYAPRYRVSAIAAPMSATRSSRCTQLIHWRPLPSGPPAKIANNGSIFPSAPPSLASTMPMRSTTWRTSSGSRAASASHSRHTRARKSEPGPDFSVNVSVLLVP
mmetsp:Transcript_19909/g.59128  ORF Transcript_19909/g.59128 Transcript_19909/m.59128 type:complete len:211 (-) Transcript_19909:496-1128(-)